LLAQVNEDKELKDSKIKKPEQYKISKTNFLKNQKFRKNKTKESNFLKIQNNNKLKENHIFIKKITEKLKI